MTVGAASLGYREDMISALEVMATHHAPMQRIGALEDENLAWKKIGNLFTATPLATNRDNVGESNEVVRLTIVLVLVGICWFSVRANEMLKHKQIANAVRTLQSVNPGKK